MVFAQENRPVQLERLNRLVRDMEAIEIANQEILAEENRLIEEIEDLKIWARKR